MTKFIDKTREGKKKEVKKKEVKKTVLTHCLDTVQGWLECHIEYMKELDVDSVIYLGKCGVNGDIFMIKENEYINQFKGTKGDEPFTDKYIDCSGEKHVEKVKFKTVFTECIDVTGENIRKALSGPEIFATVEYLYTINDLDIFAATTENGGKFLYSGKKGDEFNN